MAPTFYFAIGSRPAAVDLQTALAVAQREFLIPVGSTLTRTLQQIPGVGVVLDSAAWPPGNPNRPTLEQYAEAILDWQQPDGSWGNLSWAAAYDHIGDPARTQRDNLRLLALLAEAGAVDAPVVPVTHYPGPAVETILLDLWHGHAGTRADVMEAAECLTGRAMVSAAWCQCSARLVHMQYRSRLITGLRRCCLISKRR